MAESQTPDKQDDQDRQQRMPGISEPGAGDWSSVWQLPVLLLGIVLFGAGLYMAIPEEEKPDYVGTLDSAERALVAGDLEQAELELDKVRQNIDEAPRREQGRYYMFTADRIFLEQRDSKGDVEENHRTVIRNYLSAEQLDVLVGPDQLQRWAQTLVALRQVDAALRLLKRLKNGPPSQRYTLVRQIIEQRQARGGVGLEQLTPLIERFLDELRGEANPSAHRRQELWITALRAKAWIASGSPRDAIDLLSKKILRLEDVGGNDDLAPLYLLLAQGFAETGENEEAHRYYQQTQSLVESSDVINADVLVGLGQLALTETDNATAARDLFHQAVTHFPKQGPYIDALLGLGDSEAKLSLHDNAIKHLDMAVAAIATSSHSYSPHRGQLLDIAQSHYSLSFDKQAYGRALRYLELPRKLYQEQFPSDLLVLFAVTYDRLAESRMAQAVANTSQTPIDATAPAKGKTAPPQRAHMFQEAAIFYKKAGQFYFDHATAVTIKDDVAHGLSLWKAAQCFDYAQLWDKSIQVYSQFVKTRQSDGRYLGALHRLGLAFLAEGNEAAALEKFKYLIEHKSQAQEAFESYVPMARCYIALGEFDQAKHLLTSVVTNHPSITPGSMPYRQALVELGALHYQLEEFGDAIARYQMGVDRYEDSSAGPKLIYYLADSKRRSVGQLDEKLKEVLPQSVEQRYRQARIKRLRGAKALYKKVIERLDQMYPGVSSDAQRLIVRNSYFYQADCAYQLQAWDEARSLYDTAAKRWEKHPISLVALIQIVNIYAEQNRFYDEQGDAAKALSALKDARIANERARFQLKRIPEDAFDDPTLPLSRDHWKNWLRWSSELGLFASQASARGE